MYMQQLKPSTHAPAALALILNRGRALASKPTVPGTPPFVSAADSTRVRTESVSIKSCDDSKRAFVCFPRECTKSKVTRSHHWLSSVPAMWPAPSIDDTYSHL